MKSPVYDCVVVTVVSGLITMLVMGILGSVGTMSIPPLGSQLMIGIAASLLAGIISACIKDSCCRH